MPENSGAHSGKHQRASGLTPRQADVLALIQKRTKEDNASPTYREIGEALGITSTNGVADHVKALIRKGYLRQGPNRAPRNLQPTTKSQAKHDLVVAVPIIDRSRRKWIRLDRSLLPLGVDLVCILRGRMLDGVPFDRALVVVARGENPRSGNTNVYQTAGTPAKFTFLREPGAVYFGAVVLTLTLPDGREPDLEMSYADPTSS
jgi:SOS-response transcriptional repressor LexA